MREINGWIGAGRENNVKGGAFLGSHCDSLGGELAKEVKKTHQKNQEVPLS